MNDELPLNSGDDLGPVWGPDKPTDRPPRLLGLFAHPDDEVFCVGGTIARCSAEGADTTLLSLTQGEAGQIRDAATATRRTLGSVRAAELTHSARALGVTRSECLDLGDGHLDRLPFTELVAVAQSLIERVAPDVVVTFAADGAFGHPDHITSCRATAEALRAMPHPPRLLHARFPSQEQLLLDLLVQWLTSGPGRFNGTAAFGHALKLFADGSSMLGFAADHLDVQWFPSGSYLIEQGEPARELFCILSGRVDIVVEDDDGRMTARDTVGPGSFVGEDGLASKRPRNAHVIAHDDVTCFVLAPGARDLSAGRGADRVSRPTTSATGFPRDAVEETPSFCVDVRTVLDRKIDALAAHRSQYALEPGLLPRQILDPLLGTEHFALIDVTRWR